jgi:hypothetical protein
MLANIAFNNKYLEQVGNQDTKRPAEQKQGKTERNYEVLHTEEVSQNNSEANTGTDRWAEHDFPLGPLGLGNTPHMDHVDTLSTSSDEVAWLAPRETSMATKVKKKKYFPESDLDESEDEMMVARHDRYYKGNRELSWDNLERKRLKMEWKELHEKKEELFSMMWQFGQRMNGTANSGVAWHMGGTGVGVVPTTVSPHQQGGIQTYVSPRTTMNYETPNNYAPAGWQSTPIVKYEPVPQWTTHLQHKPVTHHFTERFPPSQTSMNEISMNIPTIKREPVDFLQTNHAPNKGEGVITKDKNAERRLKAQEKREALADQEEKRQEQEEIRLQVVKGLKDEVSKKESNRTKKEKAKANFFLKESQKKSNVKKQPKSLEAEQKGKNTKVKVKRHSTDNTGKITAEVQINGGKTIWMKLEDFWTAENMDVYGPAWQMYYKKKPLASLPETGIEPIEVETSGQVVENLTDEEAYCYNHLLDDKGVVFMELRWREDGVLSRHPVRKIMSNPLEKKKFGGTWLEYCDGKGIQQELFRNGGQSVVKTIKEHAWGEDGRPLVEIEWVHGEITKVPVKNAMDYKGDGNGFLVAWNKYCDETGMTAEGFRKGHVDKAHKREKLTKKKKRTNK